ncbi:MAG: hypothetical protein G01um101466_854 [Parcubacteria group bacterium Gr01-1014_66]|nr:MAG: hypothetical protein G01um101466_854 [Parcubacteria group bacterium Gr01-1014_66]
MIKRTIFNDLVSHLDQKEISLLIGPRQVGKTTLMRMLQEKAAQKGEKTLFLSMDIEREREFFSSQSSLLQKISLEVGKGRAYIFLDEIQRKEDAGLFLKGLYDMDLPYKFIVSGSGSVELKERVHESLAGRKRMFEVLPVSFQEFADYATGYRYEGRLSEFFVIEKEETLRLLDMYLRFGGYPRVITSETQEEKTRIIDEIYRSYLERDITSLLRVEKLDAFSGLVRVLAGQAGKLVRTSELSATLGIALPTVKTYLFYLEKTFIIERVTPYFGNIRKEITKSPAVYFFDLGLRNYALGGFGMPLRPDDAGFLFQNLSSLLPLRMKWRLTAHASASFLFTILYGRNFESAKHILRRSAAWSFIFFALIDLSR